MESCPELLDCLITDLEQFPNTKVYPFLVNDMGGKHTFTLREYEMCIRDSVMSVIGQHSCSSVGMNSDQDVYKRQFPVSVC